MPGASYLQTSFLGGEFSPFFQGRMDDERYRKGLVLCQNGFPVEEGSWSRRAGTQLYGTTRSGADAIVRQFAFTQTKPYNIEITEGHIRLFSGPNLVLDGTYARAKNVTSANPGVFYCPNPHPFVQGDQVVILQSDADVSSVWGTLRAHPWQVNPVDANHYTLSDPITGLAFDGTTVTLGTRMILCARVLDFTTPWVSGQHRQVRVVQGTTTSANLVLMLQGSQPPQVLQAFEVPAPTINRTTPLPFANFSFGPASFQDGPYFDPPTDGSYIVPSGTSGVITLTINYNTWSSATTYAQGQNVLSGGIAYTSLQDNNTNNTPASSTNYWQVSNGAVGVGILGFQQSDIGRAVRLFSEPSQWSSGTAYAVGNSVKYNGAYWTCAAASTNNPPDVSPTKWNITTTAAGWTWGTILTVPSATSVTVQIKGGPLLSTNNINTYRLGLYSGTTGYPTNGCFHEGRFWLAGAQPNRIDASCSNDPFNFTPTLPDGTVADNLSIAAVFNASDKNSIYWLAPDDRGVVAGTQAGEWVIAASALNDPITPTSIQAHRVTKYGCANIEPIQTGLSRVFVQSIQRKLLEFIGDPYSGKFSATNLALQAKHLTVSGIKEIARQQEIAPIIWCVMNDGTLAGVTYKRESPFGTQPASFSAWHRHTLGSGRLCLSVQTGSSVSGFGGTGVLDTVTLVTKDPATGVCYVEAFTDIFDQNTLQEFAWFVDAGRAPTGVDYVSGTPNTIVLSGYPDFAGQQLSVWGAGLDLGTYTVSAGGQITIPVGDGVVAGGQFTNALLTNQTAKAASFGSKGVTVNVGDNPPVTSVVAEFLASGQAPDYSLVSADWVNRLLYVCTTGDRTSATAGFYKFNIDTTQQLTFRPYSSIFPANIVTNPTSAGEPRQFCHGVDGYVYIGSFNTNFGPVRKYSSNFNLVATYGVESTFGGNGIPYPQTMFTFAADRNYLLVNGIYSIPGTVLLDADNMTPISISDPGNLFASMEKSRPGTMGGQFNTSQLALTTMYWLGTSAVSDVTSSTSFSVYEIAVRSVLSPPSATVAPVTRTLSKVGTVNSSQIGPGYLIYQSSPSGGVCYDPTDNNLLALVNMQNPLAWSGGNTYAAGAYVSGSNGSVYTSVASGNTGHDPTSTSGFWTLVTATPLGNVTYLVKISTLDGSVLFSLLLSNGVAPVRFEQCRIKKGRLALANGSGTISYINTLTGSIISNTAVTGNYTNNQVYDAVSGRFVFWGNNSGGGPTGPTFTGQWATYNGNPPDYTSVFVAGAPFVSAGQLLRPIAPAEAGSANGPALGKTRRSHMFSILFNRSQGVSVGTNAAKLHALTFKSPGGTPLPSATLYSGVYWDTLEDDYSFDSQPMWQVSRPYPVNVLAVEVFTQTQDR